MPAYQCQWSPAPGCPPASLAARCYALSRPCSPRARMHATLCPGGANAHHLSAPNRLPHFSPKPFRLLLKRPISSSVECGAFREKSGGIINQGSHRRRHVTLGRDPPVQTKQFDLKSFPLSSTLEKELQELLRKGLYKYEKKTINRHCRR